ncbi:hypothetical protein [Pollutimonas bauzanensis]|nr:hypothetical protein [Pollutimonas bauzanensis]
MNTAAGAARGRPLFSEILRFNVVAPFFRRWPILERPAPHANNEEIPMAEQPADKAKEAIEKGAESADRAISTAASKASDATARVKNIAEDALDDGRDALENALVCAKDAVRANPITAVAVVAAIFYLWGRMKK